MMCVMTDDLYERYKEALRTGHVAVLRGSREEALAAYTLAAEIAPSRALPHTSLGSVHMRLGHLQAALAEFAIAVERSPHDEGALLGQAEALATAGMHADAAAALDQVAEIQEAAGRLPEAADTLRRAVELDEAPDRIRRQRALLRQIRFSSGDHAAEQLLARALRLRDEPSTPSIRTRAASPLDQSAPPATPAIPLSSSDRSWPARAAVVEESQPVEAEPAPEVSEAPVAQTPATEETWAPEGEPELVAAAELPADEHQAVGVMDGVDGPPKGLLGAFAETEPQPSGDVLLAAAEAADLAGDSTALRSLLLWTARAYAREGRFDAGLDATHRLLQREPSDVDAHLVLVELYVARSWDGLAAEKLKLLGRLAELNNDTETRERLCEAATRSFPKNEDLQSLCS